MFMYKSLSQISCKGTMSKNESIIDPDWISDYLVNNFDHLNVVHAWGEKSFFYNPDNAYKRGIYFCTIKEKDGDNDKACNLDRPNVFRINFGITKPTFLALFGPLPVRPAKGHCIQGDYDFTQLDLLMPHPVYGWMAWVSVLNPTATTWDCLENLLVESYQLCIKKSKK